MFGSDAGLFFDVVAKDPERPHVRDDVEPAAMQELMREDRPVSLPQETRRKQPNRDERSAAGTIPKT
jgi:hypothetical protein